MQRGIPHPTYTIDSRDFDTDPRGKNDSYSGIAQMVREASVGDALHFSLGGYVSSQTVQINTAALTFRGNDWEQTGIQLAGGGPCIQLGTDDGQPWDSANYNGVGAGFTLEHMYLRPATTDTPLLNGNGNYKAGTYGIRDWRGGSLRIIRADIRQFDTGIWGTQSDVNYTQNCKIAFNHVGVFGGPRSDQWTFDHVWTFGNDTTFYLNGVHQWRVGGWATDTDGSNTTNVVVVRNANYGGTIGGYFNTGNVFDTPWLEAVGSLGAGAGSVVEAFFDVNVGDTTAGGALTIRDPFVVVYPYTDVTKRHVQYLVKADHCASVSVDGIDGNGVGNPWSNLQAVFKIVDTSGSTNMPFLWFRDKQRINGNLIESTAATATFMQIATDGLHAYGVNVAGGTGTVNLGHLALHRAFTSVGAKPSSGTFSAGDWLPVRGWGTGKDVMWVAGGGSPGSFFPLRIPTTSPDRGDAAATLTFGTDHDHQRWATPLTADRAVTWGTTNALNGHRMRITREASATGAFNLNVPHTAGTKALTAGTWADFCYDGNSDHSGPGIRLEAAGSL